MDKFLIPKTGLIVRDPFTKEPLPEHGALKPWVGRDGRYWRRRVKCGDCVVGNPPKKVKKEVKD